MPHYWYCTAGFLPASAAFETLTKRRAQRERVLLGIVINVRAGR